MIIPPEYLNQIVTGDARELEKRIPDESVDLVLTDPPFGIGFKYSNGYMDYEPEIDASVILYDLADGSVGCSLPDLRYVFYIALGMVVGLAALAMALTHFGKGKRQ